MRARIVTAFLEHDGLVLILKRSMNVKSMKGKWAGISGYIEDEEPIDAAIREIEEETGIERSKLRFIAKGSVIEVYDNDITWLVHPFRFYTDDTNRRLESEHDEYRWIKPEEIIYYDTVPKLKETLDSVTRFLDSDLCYKES